MDRFGGAIVVISGPSGCGKSSLINTVITNIEDCYVSISTTTRAKRVNETDTKEYYFITKEEFIKEIDDGNFLEYALVHGNYYGTSIKPVLKALDNKKLVIFDIDVQGHAKIQEKFKDIATSVFITTPTLKELQNRLENRDTDKTEIIKNRLKMAKIEVLHAKEYNFVLINDDFNETVNILLDIIKVAKLKKYPYVIDKFISEWVR